MFVLFHNTHRTCCLCHPQKIARISNPAVQSILPRRNTLRQPVNPATRDMLVLVESLLDSIDGVSCIKETKHSGGVFELVVQASGNTWSRSVRRKKASRMETDEEQYNHSAVALQCRLTFSGTEMEFNWIKGKDRGLFESFVSHISRKILS